MGFVKTQKNLQSHKLGYSYFDMTMDELDAELETFKQLKKKENAK